MAVEEPEVPPWLQLGPDGRVPPPNPGHRPPPAQSQRAKGGDRYKDNQGSRLRLLGGSREHLKGCWKRSQRGALPVSKLWGWPKLRNALSAPFFSVLAGASMICFVTDFIIHRKLPEGRACPVLSPQSPHPQC